MNIPSERILADASLSTDGLGKIGTVAAGATLYVRTPCGPTIERVLWRVKCNKQHTVTLYRCLIIPAPTITLSDATPVDADDTFVLNGLTFTYKAGANVVASRFIGLGADNAAAAVNTAAMLSDATYGVPGITFTVAAVGATDVITNQPTTAPVVQFAQGTSDANEVAFATPVLASLIKDGAAVSGLADNSTTAGTIYEQWISAWEQAYLAITNDDGANPATVTVAARLLPWT